MKKSRILYIDNLANIPLNIGGNVILVKEEPVWAFRYIAGVPSRKNKTVDGITCVQFLDFVQGKWQQFKHGDTTGKSLSHSLL